MTRNHFFLTCMLAVAALVLVTAASAAPLAQTEPGDPLDPRTYAPESRSYLAVHAVGTQNYACRADGTWLFTGPEATLFRKPGGKAFGTHYLNVATGRPVWEWKDGSFVEAARHASAPGGAENIAWLLLRAVATGVGPDGGDRFAATAWVQRLNTAGGVAPAEPCEPGEQAAVPYTTDYVFWTEGT